MISGGSDLVINTTQDIMPSQTPKMAAPTVPLPPTPDISNGGVTAAPPPSSASSSSDETVEEAKKQKKKKTPSSPPKPKVDINDVNSILKSDPVFADEMSTTIPTSPKGMVDHIGLSSAATAAPNTGSKKHKSKKSSPKKHKKPETPPPSENESESSSSDGSSSSSSGSSSSGSEGDEQEQEQAPNEGQSCPMPPPSAGSTFMSPEEELKQKLSVIEDIKTLSQMGFIPTQAPSLALPLVILKQIASLQADQMNQELCINMFGHGFSSVIRLVEFANKKLDPGRFIGMPLKLDGSADAVSSHINMYRSPFIKIYKKYFRDRGMTEVPIWVEMGLTTVNILAAVHADNVKKEMAEQARKEVNDPEAMRQALELQRKLAAGSGAYNLPPTSPGGASDAADEKRLINEAAGFDTSEVLPKPGASASAQAAQDAPIYVTPPPPPKGQKQQAKPVETAKTTETTETPDGGDEAIDIGESGEEEGEDIEVNNEEEEEEDGDSDNDSFVVDDESEESDAKRTIRIPKI